METEAEMEEHVVPRDGNLDLKFAGALIGAAETDEVSGRWTEIKIYRTGAGKYVVSVAGRTKWQGEYDRHEAHVCDTEEAVLDALAQEDPDAEETGQEVFYSWVAKEALRDAGIDVTETIE